MSRSKPISGEIYHIYNRGVEKRKVFMNDKDYLRFIHDLFEFNDIEPTINLNYHLSRRYKKLVGVQSIDVSHRYIKPSRQPRKLLVDILAFCLMPNHFHLLLKQRIDDGVTLFMKKLGSGYTNYFNQKYERVGALFQGVYRYAIVKNDSHFIHLPYYIHMNPLDLIIPEWHAGEIKDINHAIEFLENYQWSSYLDYIGKKNFPSVTQRELLSEFLSSPKNYRKETIKWLTEFKPSQIEFVALEEL